MKYPYPKKMNCPVTKKITKPKKAKYNNHKVTIDGIKFDSTKEGKRYQQLKQLEKDGEIKDLRLQVKFELQPPINLGYKKIRAINYVADFTYRDNMENLIVEDVKGMKTSIYKMKAKMFAYKYGFEISEV